MLPVFKIEGIPMQKRLEALIAILKDRLKNPKFDAQRAGLEARLNRVERDLNNLRNPVVSKPDPLPLADPIKKTTKKKRIITQEIEVDE